MYIDNFKGRKEGRVFLYVCQARLVAVNTAFHPINRFSYLRHPPT
jgi:hypothetical protein